MQSDMTSRKLNFEPLTFCIMYTLLIFLSILSTMVFVLTERDNTVEPQLLEKTTKVHTVYTRSLLNMQYSLLLS